VIAAQPNENIEIWGDGLQTRSFLYIDDCIDAIRLLVESEESGPFNIGSEEMISINDFAKLIVKLSKKEVGIKNIDGPTGVRGRCSDNKLIREKLNWEPKYKLQEGIAKTYDWIADQMGK
ncbi:MAG: GDP-D-mannose 3',5'-epimerase, partial [Flavobacteriaceae bacterium]